MSEFIENNIVTIIFGIITAIMSAIALRYTIREHRQKIEHRVEGPVITLFLTRDSMTKYLLEMYDKANKGDVIWGECVGCKDYTSAVRAKILEAAGRGVSYKIIVNKYAPTLAEFRSLYDPIHTADLLEGQDNALRVQGLADREVVIALPGVNSYTSILIRDKFFTKIIKEWFDARFQTMKNLQNVP